MPMSLEKRRLLRMRKDLDLMRLSLSAEKVGDVGFVETEGVMSGREARAIVASRSMLAGLCLGRDIIARIESYTRQRAVRVAIDCDRRGELLRQEKQRAHYKVLREWRPENESYVEYYDREYEGSKDPLTARCKSRY